MWTSFDYMYRDAGNFKAFGSIALRGDLGHADRQEIQSRLDRGEYFIAEQIGVPPLYQELCRWSDGPTLSDHCWHEFISFREMKSRPSEHIHAVDAPTFVERFRTIAKWDGSLSPHFELGW